uniref:basic salivary proline-rich protein 1-like isoform X1 n=1 Tax=Oncorhynchus gorbuscha TaxID=8017 RepID=UPI001EAF413D|nr:basic salivary proline-rich protein 1-like isoform X1 [Oncorhynchus gorbuscha]XP_046171157.1 basic salivary proline-rich protein 1-like isoform X1 [Oncorhynchus gorbuscha]XP_046171158.1 basic salivary proline-rich protein 1-like isoform X1 [Oncorhynchus gorbuscha]
MFPLRRLSVKMSPLWTSHLKAGTLIWRAHQHLKTVDQGGAIIKDLGAGEPDAQLCSGSKISPPIWERIMVGSVKGIMEDSLLTLVSLTDITLKDHGLAEEGEMDEVSDQEGIVEKESEWTVLPEEDASLQEEETTPLSCSDAAGVPVVSQHESTGGLPAETQSPDPEVCPQGGGDSSQEGWSQSPDPEVCPQGGADSGQEGWSQSPDPEVCPQGGADSGQEGWSQSPDPEVCPQGGADSGQEGWSQSPEPEVCPQGGADSGQEGWSQSPEPEVCPQGGTDSGQEGWSQSPDPEVCPQGGADSGQDG